ncbi:MAG: cellulose binding domain-containing protein, partial [Candidatus Dependentiae bacterium]|nr:cellulose binding domain-containing protein [Candidatus Dependentiae bacterium]
MNLIKKITLLIWTIFIIHTSELKIQAGQTFNSGGFSINFSVTNDWGTGCQALVTITNTSSVQTQKWTIDFDLMSSDQSIGNLWNGVKNPTVSQGTHVEVSNPTWYQAGYLNPGQS